MINAVDIESSKLKIEGPRTFDTIPEAVDWHENNRCIGWFVVGNMVFWTYGAGDYSRTLLTSEQVEKDPPINFFEDEQGEFIHA